MPKLELTKEEIAILQDGLDKASASAKRAQNTAQPQIAEVYKTVERNITALSQKIADAK